MILVINLNLAIDQIIQVENLQIGQVHRSKSTLRQAGGKGVNVARVLRTLGEPCIVSGFLGGHAGEHIADGLRAEDLAFDCTPIQNESRTCVIVNDSREHRQTVINEPGPEISSSELDRFMMNYKRLLDVSELVIITGSLPPCLPVNTYADLIRVANHSGRRVLLDSSSAALHYAIRAQPLVVKVNHAEAGELLDRQVVDFISAAEAADGLIQMGATHAMITMGAQGALLAFAGVKYRLIPPPVQARNSVGSGDAVMAGLATGLRRGYSAAQMGVLAIAAGAANALHGGGHCTVEEISQIQPQVVCRIEDSSSLTVREGVSPYRR